MHITTNRSFSNGDGAASDAGQTQIEPGSQEGGSESREGEVANGKAEGGEGGGGGTGEVEKEDQVVVPDQPEETLTEATEKDKEGERSSIKTDYIYTIQLFFNPRRTRG